MGAGRHPPNDVPPDPPPPMRDKAGSPEAEQSPSGALGVAMKSLGKMRVGLSHGEKKSLMQPQPLANVHPFSMTLHKWQNGIQVDCGPNWKWEDCEAAVKRGTHHSATTPEAIELLNDDISYQQRAGFCRAFTWDDLKRTQKPKLKILPVVVVPQVGRRGRIILDLSFPVYQEVDSKASITQASVNKTTITTGPAAPVKEIGKVLHQLLYFMKMTRAGIWIQFLKLDISDGFWRLVIKPEDSYNFAYVLPQHPGQLTKIVVPSALQMGWLESPSYF